MKNKELSLMQRIEAPTPKFFKTLRTIGLIVGTVAAGILTAPVSIPAGVITIAGYLGVAGGIITAVSQTAVQGEEEGSSSGK